MPYVGDSLTSLAAEPVRDVASEATRKMAERARDFARGLAVKRTPVKTGKLAAGWEDEQAAAAEGGWRTGLKNSVSYAAVQESGSGLYGPRHAKYLILPRKPGGVLHWVGPDGLHHFAKHVWHPGVKPHWMLARAMDVTAAGLEGGALVGDVLEKWARESEAAIEKKA